MTIILGYMRRTGQSAAVVSSQIWRDRAVYMGGRSWECVRCGGRLEAECSCCAPPACNCGRPQRATPEHGA